MIQQLNVASGSGVHVYVMHIESGCSISIEVYNNTDQDRTTRAPGAHCILYLNSINTKTEPLRSVLNFVPRAYNFGDGRYSELK